MRFRLHTILVFVTIAGLGCGIWRNHVDITLRRQSLIRQCEEYNTSFPVPRFGFVSEDEIEQMDGTRYRVLLFDSVMKSWPGQNPYKIVVVSRRYRVLRSGVFGGQEFMQAHTICGGKDRAVLKIICAHRGRFDASGTHTYHVSPKAIEVVGGVEWSSPRRKL